MSSTAREIARIAGWANEITARRGRGELVHAGELLDYQRAKVALLANDRRARPVAGG